MDTFRGDACTVSSSHTQNRGTQSAVYSSRVPANEEREDAGERYTDALIDEEIYRMYGVGEEG